MAFLYERPSLLTSIILVVLTTIFVIAAWPKKVRWDPRDKHCYVTGGSSGLGKALAVLLAEKGAHVSIVARNEARLAETLAEMEKSRQTESQVFKSYAYSLNDSASATAALDAVSKPFEDQGPDAIFLCAGSSKPGFFVEETADSLKEGMDNAFWVQAWTAWAAAKRFARDKKGGRLVFVSSALGLMSFAGYSSYAPGKHALRGLAETLRSELLLYSVWVHIFFPGTIFSPGFENEEKTKPYITKKIEEQDQGMKPREAAEGLLQGVETGVFHIANDFTINIIRATTRGASPMNSVITDALWALLGYLSLPSFRRKADEIVVRERLRHRKYLQEKDVKL